MYNPGPSFYMQKLVVGQAARDVIDLDAPVHVNLRLIAKALGKDTNDLVVFVLDKPRHQKLIQEIRAVGARIQLHTDGDVARCPDGRGSAFRSRRHDGDRRHA